jgi:outer membrane protein assembly factor BamB
MYSPSFSPRTALFAAGAGGRAAGGGGRRGGGRFLTPAYRKEEEGYGAVRALDPQTGEKKWDFKMVDYTESGVLTTASDLLFSGGREGNFFALDARTGGGQAGSLQSNAARTHFSVATVTQRTLAVHSILIENGDVPGQGRET